MKDFYYWFVILFFIVVLAWRYLLDLKKGKARGKLGKNPTPGITETETDIASIEQPASTAQPLSLPTQGRLKQKPAVGILLVCVGVMFLFVTLWGPILSFLNRDSITRLIPGLEIASTRTDSRDELIRIGKDAVLPLIEVLTNGPAIARSAAAHALGAIGDERAIEPLIGVLDDPDSFVRLAAVVALNKYSDERAVDPLILMLKDGSPEIRVAAAEALGHLGYVRAVEPLIAVLEFDLLPPVRVAAALALGRYGNDRVTQALKAVVDRKDLVVVAKASAYLIKIGDDGDEPVFIEALNIYGNSSTATIYLNSGNRILSEAATTWAKAHGYELIPSYRQNSIGWGSGN